MFALIRTFRRYSRWITVLLFAIAVFFLGFAGFQRHFQLLGKTRPNSDVVYLTFQLFIFESGSVEGPIDWQLQAARFLAPAVTAYAGLYALWSIFYHQVLMVRPWFAGRHVVVCGLGRKGARLIEQLRARGECVVAIENNQGCDEVEHARQRGVIVLSGAANDRWLLRKACVHRAKTLICITGDDGVNVETAVLAHEMNRRRRIGSLDCVVHLFDPRLERMLKGHEIFTDRHDPFELRFFNTFEIGARAMLNSPPVLDPETGPQPQRPHLLIVGLGRLGERLLVRAADEWRAKRQDPQSRLLLTVVDWRAKIKEKWLPLRYPWLEEVADTRCVEIDIQFPEFATGSFLDPKEDVPKLTAAYVCLDDDSLGMFAGLALHDYLQDNSIPIVVRMTEQAGLASLLGAQTDGTGIIPGIHAVGLLEVACNLDLVLARNPGSPPRQAAE